MPKKRKLDTFRPESAKSKAQTTRSEHNCTDTLLYILKAPLKYPKTLFLGLLLAGGAGVGFLFGKSSGQRQSVVHGKSADSYQDPTNSENQHDPCRFFPLFKGVNATKANRILIGELHNHRSKTNECLNHLAPPQPHTVLLEDAVSGVELVCSDPTRGISEKPGRKCIGWNSKESVEKSVSEMKQDAHAKLLKEFKSKYDEHFSKTKKSVKDFDKDADMFLSGLIKSTQKDISTNKFDKRTHKPPAPFSSQARELRIQTQALKTYQELNELRNSGRTWEQIFAANTHHSAKDIKHERFVTMDEDALTEHYNSNVQLLNTLRAQDPTSITFAVTGAYHLTPFDVPIENTAADHLLNGLEEDGIPFSVMAMRL